MKAVIFDLGNVLVHYDGEATFRRVSELTAVSLEELFIFYQKHDHAFGTGQISGRGYYNLLVKTYGMQASYQTFVTTFCRSEQRNEKALAFALALQARPNVIVGIISNINEIHTAWVRANLPELAQFSSVILSDEVGLLKPDSAIYQLALSQLNVPPNHALFVDDLLENVRGGTAVGLSGCHHTSWQQTRPFIEKWLQE